MPVIEPIAAASVPPIPAATVPMAHRTVPALASKVHPAGRPVGVAPAGTATTSSTPVADDGPVLVTANVVVNVPPGVAGSGASVTDSTRSPLVATVVVVVAVLLAVAGSAVVDPATTVEVSTVPGATPLPTARVRVRDALAPDGTWMIVKPAAEDRVEDNLGPVGRIYYSASTMACLPNALSQAGGYALGAQAGEAAIRRVVTEAGFCRFRRAAGSRFNAVYEVRL